jgi:hypothetical protein
MGYWGPGNFENDFALNTLFSFTGEITETCRSIIEHEPANGEPYSGYWDMEGDSEFMPMLEILCLLAETYGGCSLPSAEKVRDWKARFMEANFGEDAGRTGDAEYLVSRKEAVEATFERLLRLSMA